MLKTYADDLKFVNRLIFSLHEHNQDQIPLYIVTPKSDLPLFQKFANDGVYLISEESIPCQLAPPGDQLRDSGYINQQVLKLAFHRLGIADNYLCLDSDAEFIKNFTLDDFFHPDGLPYQVLVEDKALQGDADYYSTYWKGRSKKLDEIANFLEMSERKLLKTCHGQQIFQAKVLERFENEILSPMGGGGNFLDIILQYGYEFTWYNYYLQKTELLIHEVEPWFHYIHSGKQLVRSQLFSETNEDLSKGFLGVVVNGNFQLFRWPANLEKNRILNAAAYLTTRDLIRITCRFGAAFLIRILTFPAVQVRRTLVRLRRYVKY